MAKTGVPWIKAPPMGKVQLTGPSGENMGYVNFKTAPLPPAPPPTIVRFGDVGVAPAGCPMCPVLDEEAVKKQKEELKKNAHKIERLEKADAVRLWIASMGRAWRACLCALDHQCDLHACGCLFAFPQRTLISQGSVYVPK